MTDIERYIKQGLKDGTFASVLPTIKPKSDRLQQVVTHSSSNLMSKAVVMVGIYKTLADAEMKIQLNGSEYVSCLSVLGIKKWMSDFAAIITQKNDKRLTDAVRQVNIGLAKWEKEVFQCRKQGDVLKDFIQQRVDTLQMHFTIFFYSLRGSFVKNGYNDVDALAYQTLICSVLDIPSALYHKLNMHRKFVPWALDENRKTRIASEVIESMDLGCSECINDPDCQRGVDVLFKKLCDMMYSDMNQNITLEV